MQYWKKAAALCAIMVTAGGVAMAAEPAVYTLGPVVVTANRTETPELDTNADINVVTSKEIQERHYEDVSQAVRHVPGVFLANASASGQNYNSNKVYINGSDKVVLLVDGIRMNTNGLSTGSAVTLAQRVNMNSIDRIEVLKGAASTLYGADAQGGVINIITKKAADGEVSTMLGASFGSYDGESYNLYNQGSKDGFFWNVDAQKQLQGEYKDAWGNKVINALNAEAYNLRFGKELGNDSSLVFNYNKYKSDYQRPDYGSSDLTRDFGKKDNESISLQYNAKITDKLDNQFSLYRNKNTFRDNYKSTDTYWFMDMKSTGVSDQLTYKAGSQTWVGGFEHYKDEIPVFASYGSVSGAQGQSLSNTAFYLQDTWDISDEWNVTPGIRWDHNSEYGNHTTPSFTVGFKANDKVNYYASYKEFFVAPDLYQMYDAYSGNKNLDPQEGGTFSLGMNRILSDSLTLNVSAYRQHAKNLIIYDMDAWKYTNTGSVDSYGGNVQLSKSWGDHWSTTLGYTYTYIDGSETTNANNNGFLPRHTLDFLLSYDTKAFNASLAGRGVLDREGGKGTQPIEQFKNYWVWDFAANYRVNEYTSVFFKANNIFDQYYQEAGTAVAPGSLGSTVGWYSQPGRNFEAGVQFKF